MLLSKNSRNFKIRLIACLEHRRQLIAVSFVLPNAFLFPYYFSRQLHNVNSFRLISMELFRRYNMYAKIIDMQDALKRVQLDGIILGTVVLSDWICFEGRRRCI